MPSALSPTARHFHAPPQIRRSKVLTRSADRRLATPSRSARFSRLASLARPRANRYRIALSVFQLLASSYLVHLRAAPLSFFECDFTEQANTLNQEAKLTSCEELGRCPLEPITATAGSSPRVSRMDQFATRKKKKVLEGPEAKITATPPPPTTKQLILQATCQYDGRLVIKRPRCDTRSFHLAPLDSRA